MLDKSKTKCGGSGLKGSGMKAKGCLGAGKVGKVQVGEDKFTSGQTVTSVWWARRCARRKGRQTRKKRARRCLQMESDGRAQASLRSLRCEWHVYLPFQPAIDRAAGRTEDRRNSKFRRKNRRKSRNLRSVFELSKHRS